MWRRALRIVPAPVANIMLRAGDAVARRVPSVADMLISVWVRR
jgi:hypothetical protein